MMMVRILKPAGNSELCCWRKVYGASGLFLGCMWEEFVPGLNAWYWSAEDRRGVSGAFANPMQAMAWLERQEPSERRAA